MTYGEVAPAQVAVVVYTARSSAGGQYRRSLPDDGPCSPDYFKPQDVKKLLQHDLEEQMNPGLYVVFKRALDVVGEATTTTVSRWI